MGTFTGDLIELSSQTAAEAGWAPPCSRGTEARRAESPLTSRGRRHQGLSPSPLAGTNPKAWTPPHISARLSPSGGCGDGETWLPPSWLLILARSENKESCPRVRTGLGLPAPLQILAV